MINDTGIAVAFWVLAATTVGCALMVVMVRELIHAVLFLALCFVGVAGIYIVLSADFVAVAQILIYAGAIAVLMTFAVMLTPAADRENSETAFWAPAAVLAGLVLVVITYVTYATSWHIAGRGAFPATAASLGEAFLKPYVVPFEVASVLLMTAMIGAIVLTKEDEEPESA
ncbi:MAG TPA: NADH-quinone oxidoreductase subunit J [Dehalococcoidia bacterium]|nr:NADH-quinone oxidoreductase subunit J [Dehalococcoidia bacterium]